MAYLPSPAQLASGRNDAIVEQVLAVVAAVNNSHLQNNGALVDTVEEHLFTNNGPFDGQFDRWAVKRRRRVCFHRCILHMTRSNASSPLRI